MVGDVGDIKGLVSLWLLVKFVGEIIWRQGPCVLVCVFVCLKSVNA